jgi:hypothetical protein
MQQSEASCAIEEVGDNRSLSRYVLQVTRVENSTAARRYCLRLGSDLRLSRNEKQNMSCSVSSCAIEEVGGNRSLSRFVRARSH